MRIVELLNSVSIPLNNEEWDILKKFNDNVSVLKSDMSPREQLLANQLVKKDVLLRKKNAEGKLTYTKKIR